MGVAYDGGQWVVVGSEGTLLTSPDGVTWTTQTPGTPEHLYGAAYDGSQWVVVGDDGIILTSPDGATWTAQTSGTTERLNDVVYGGGQFVTVGTEGTILTSSDGVTWTAQASGTTYYLRHVTYGGGQWVAVGAEYDEYGMMPVNGVILTSPDGATWTTQTSGTTEELWSVSYGDSQWVVVGSFGTILSSPDGVTWTGQTSGVTSDLHGVTYGDGQWVVVGGGTLLTSPDGVTWTADTSVTMSCFSVTYGDSQFGAVGFNGAILTSSAGPSLTLTKSVSPSSVKPGQAITYTISFSNTGTITATDVIITDTLSVNITDASFSSSGVALTQVPGSRYVWTAPDLLQNDGGVITITGVLTKPLAVGTLSNTVTLAVSGTVQTASVDLIVENVAPVSDAGVDQSVGLSETVTLDGSGTDDNGDTLTYDWTQTGGTPTVSLSNPAAQSPTFTAPSAATVLTFTLTVTDTGSLTDTDEVVVMVTAGTPGYASKPPAGGTIQFGLDMGGVKVGSPVTSTLIISETGNATLNIASLMLSGPNAADFSVSPTSFSIVDGGAAQPVSITCTPASYGLRTATLTVNHNAVGSPATYTLDCTGKVMVYLPLVLRATP